MRADVSLVNIKKNVIGHQMISTGFVKVVVHNLRPIYAQSTPNLRPSGCFVKIKQGITGANRDSSDGEENPKDIGL